VCVLEYLRLRDMVNKLLTSVVHFVVLPDASSIALCQGINQNIAGYLRSHVTLETLQKHAENSYMGPTQLVGNRSELLGALTNRITFVGRPEPMLTEDEDDLNFRSTLRILLDKAIQQALSTMDIDNTPESRTLCTMKACEIESSLHLMYPASSSNDLTFPLYRDHGRSLKRALEDPGNLFLSVQVLTEQMEADAFVHMTSDELAPQRLKDDRAVAEALARQQLSLTSESNDGSDLAKEGPYPASHQQEVEIDGEAEAQASTVAKTDHTNTVSETAATSPEPDLVDGKSLTLESPTVSPSKQSTVVSFGQLVKKASYRPPPPPPSLAASMSTNANESGTTPAPPTENIVTALDGSSHFHFEVASRSRRFTAILSVEHDPENFAHGWISPRLCEVARVPVEEFSKFLHAKLASGRNHAVVLRIVVDFDSDQQEYLKFCKLYEEKGRIAMFNLNEWAKMYLVTPKFHKSARAHITFQKATSAYAVVITKRMTENADES
jgi:hypothetical protein